MPNRAANRPARRLSRLGIRPSCVDTRCEPLRVRRGNRGSQHNSCGFLPIRAANRPARRLSRLGIRPRCVDTRCEPLRVRRANQGRQHSPCGLVPKRAANRPARRLSRLGFRADCQPKHRGLLESRPDCRHQHLYKIKTQHALFLHLRTVMLLLRLVVTKLQIHYLHLWWCLFS